MPVLSDSTFAVIFPETGNRAVYSVQPQHLNDRPGTTLSERARFYGEQLAHECNGRWYKPGEWVEITDPRTIALLERVPQA